MAGYSADRSSGHSMVRCQDARRGKKRGAAVEQDCVRKRNLRSARGVLAAPSLAAQRQWSGAGSAAVLLGREQSRLRFSVISGCGRVSLRVLCHQHHRSSRCVFERRIDRSLRQRHTLYFATVAEPELHRPCHTRRRVHWKKFAIDSIHFCHMQNIRQHNMHAHHAL
jgi:hypothetical protein